MRLRRFPPRDSAHSLLDDATEAASSAASLSLLTSDPGSCKQMQETNVGTSIGKGKGKVAKRVEKSARDTLVTSASVKGEADIEQGVRQNVSQAK